MHEEALLIDGSSEDTPLEGLIETPNVRVKEFKSPLEAINWLSFVRPNVFKVDPLNGGNYRVTWEEKV